MKYTINPNINASYMHMQNDIKIISIADFETEQNNQGRERGRSQT